MELIAVAASYLLVACSDELRSRTTTTSDDPTGTGAGGSTGGGTGGSATGGGPIIDPGRNDAGPDSGPPPLADCDPPAKPCPTGQICVTTPTGGLCSPNGGPCTSDDQCQNDTYCCAGSCRKDGLPEGVCVTGGTRPKNTNCTTTAAIGVFAPDLQCEWKGPTGSDPLPLSSHVLISPLVANLPNDSGAAAEIVIVTTEKPGGSDMADGTGAPGGVIRILNGQTCQLKETLDLMPRVRDTATPALADLDNDGKLEIVTRADGFTTNPVVAFPWDTATARYKVKWTSPSGGAPSGAKDKNWDGVSIHDLDDDGFPEVIGRGGSVFDGRTGMVITQGPTGIVLDSEPALGDVDADGQVELVANRVYRWNRATRSWGDAYPGGSADFGTRSLFYGFADFDADGKAEVVATGADMVGIYKLTGERLLRVNLPMNERGGPPTIGDFDGDRQPEVASASASAFRVFDLDCIGGGKPGCEADGIRWTKPAQDSTSAQTGSTIFDFEGDGTAEAVYADECFLRVYNGSTGDVLYSAYRSSCTWWEQPIVADPDNSTRTKIIVNSNSNCYVQCNAPATTERGTNGFIDRQHPGVRCRNDGDCVSNSCVAGFCRCTSNDTCGGNVTVGAAGYQFTAGLVCAAPLPGTPGTGNVCRAQHPNPDGIYREQLLNGIKVYRDKLDRWASSRNLWNQHAYSITNINDDGTIPKTSEWKQNFLDPKLNNFRQNRQGTTSNDLADITGSLDPANACQLTMGGGILFHGQICNRGLRGVAASMPATFYLGGGEAGPTGPAVCQTVTAGPVPVGSCLPITCEVPATQVPNKSTITMIVNDAGSGKRITDECNYVNNAASVMVEACAPPPK